MPAPNYVPAVYTTHATITPAASATDMLFIVSTDPPISIKRIQIYAGQTAAGQYTFYLVKRTAFDTGGTAVAAVVTPMDSNMAAGPSVFTYTANPTGLGASPGNFMTDTVTIPAGGPQEVLNLDLNDRPIVLKGATQLLCLNGGGVSFGAGINLVVKMYFEVGGDP